MKVPQLARYNGTVEKAYEFVKSNIDVFPIKLFELIHKFEWGVITYEEMAINSECSVDTVCKCLGTDGYSIYNGYNYTIAYNNTIKSQGRINFTLAHEIGHIILNHHKDFEVTEILQDNFTKEEYKILENEANCFARNILAPAPLVKQMKFWNVLFNLPNYFGITLKATTTRLSFLSNDLYYLKDEQIEYLQNTYKRYKYCNKCKCNHLNINTNYCPLCGNKNLIIGDGFTMAEYTGINIKELGKCPVCENGDIKGTDNYCKICGLSLNNICPTCGIELDSSARYCRDCGSASPYLVSGALKHYQHATDIRTTAAEDFAPVFDDDLPF